MAPTFSTSSSSLCLASVRVTPTTSGGGTSVKIGSGKTVYAATGSPPPVVYTEFAAGVAEASSFFSAFYVILDCVAAFPVSSDKLRRYLGLWTATVSSSLLACRFKVLDNIGKKWTQLYVSVTVLMKPLRWLQFCWSVNFPELIVAVREVRGENGTGSRQLVSESDHSCLRNARGDGDFTDTESGPIKVVDFKRREKMHESAPHPVVALSQTIEENMLVRSCDEVWVIAGQVQVPTVLQQLLSFLLLFENSVVTEFSQPRFHVHDEMRGEVGLPTLVTLLVSFNMADHNVPKDPDHIVRGALLIKESDPSFAEAHRGILSEPTHTEGEDEEVESRREVRHTSA